VKRRPWIQLLWQSAVDVLPASLGQYLVKEAKVEPWIRKDFARRTRLAVRQLGVDEYFGLWLPTRRCCISGILLMANKLSKFVLPASVVEEARYPYLDQTLIEFVLSIPASQLLRPGERRSLMRRSLVGVVPAEILARRTKQVAARTPVIALEEHWNELQNTFQTALSSKLGYIDELRLIRTIQDARAGKTVSLVRLLWTISLEYWLRGLAVRGLLDVSATPSLQFKQRDVAVSI
jgi:hypothetical protein